MAELLLSICGAICVKRSRIKNYIFVFNLILGQIWKKNVHTLDSGINAVTNIVSKLQEVHFYTSEQGWFIMK